jgi:D-3-phosphoglycerate dehydrogenase / 2-oxoglutarate reductase
MNILIADTFPKSALEAFGRMDSTVTYDRSLKGDELLRAIEQKQPQVLIVRSTKVSADMIEATPDLGLIIRAGAGYNTIDVKTASERGVYVANCPGKNAIAVAELAMGLIMSIDRRIPDNVMDLRKGQWNKQEYASAEGIYGKTLGVIGTGRIGQALILRARAFGMHVVAWSRSLTPDKADALGVDYCATPLDVAGNADFVSLHLALTDETRNMVDKPFFEAMKEGTALINTSRAQVVNEVALLDALNTRGIKAGLDVFGAEPGVKVGEFLNDIASHPSVYGTHHIGASTNQAQQAVADETVSIVQRFVNSGAVKNCVNLIERTPARYVVSVRHRNRVGVLADVLRVIRDDDNNVEAMENIIFAGAQGACANIQIDNQLSQKALVKLQAISEDVFDVNLSQIEDN